MQKIQMFPVVISLAVFLLCSGFTFELMNKPGSADLAQGLQLRDKMDFESAAKLFDQSRNSALDTETKIKAMNELGKLAVTGKTTRLSPSEGLQLLLQAEALGSTSGYMTLGDAYHYGKGTAPNAEVAMQYYDKATATNPEAWLEMAWLNQPQPATALKYFQNFLTSSGGNADISRGKMVRIAKMYRDGVIVDPNPEQAALWYRKAIRQGSVVSLSQLAKLWTINGHEPKSDIGKLWEQYGEQGRPEGQLETGLGLIDGRYGTQDPERALQYLEKAATQRPEYSYRIGRFFEELYKTTLHPAYLDHQFVWYRKAAKLGDTAAMVKLARAFRYGRGEVMDWDRAAEIYKIAADLGNEKAAIELAKLQENKAKRILLTEQREQRRLAKLREKARKKQFGYTYAQNLLRAKSGNAIAMREVGIALIQGKETKQNSVQGMDWLNKAAFAGDTPAMLKLAKSYSAGVDGNYDLQQAYGWYKKAAEAGDAEGQYQLGLGYARGIGVEKDPQQAEEWLKKSSKGGFALADDMLKTLEKAAPATPEPTAPASPENPSKKQ